MSRDALQPVGLLGGSFDPVHAGHLQLARDAQQRLELECVRFIPAGQPWQKGAVSAGADRRRMLELALQGRAGWSIDTCELDRAGASYTVETLQQLRGTLGARRSLVWIMGLDQLRRLPSWHRWTELAGLAHIAYARRAGQAGELDDVMREFIRARAADLATIHAEPAGGVVEFAMQPVDCSASALRAALAGGQDAAAAPFLAPAVLDYIRAHRLYERAPAAGASAS